MSSFAARLAPLAAPLPPWPAPSSQTALAGLSRVTLDEPVVVAMDAGGDVGAVELTLPLSAFDPPLALGVARNLATAWLPEPWALEGAVRLALNEVGLEPLLSLRVSAAVPRAWAHAPARLELRTRDGRLGIVELSAPAHQLECLGDGRIPQLL